MGYSEIFQVLGGFGLFLFSLRFLNIILERSVSKRLKPFLDRWLANPFQCISTGIFATILVQASSITIVSSMGLLKNSLITLEQSFLIMLGATVGTTFKNWLFAGSIYHYGLALIGISSLSLLFFKKMLIREFTHIILCLGFAFFGFELMSEGLAPLAEGGTFLGAMKFYQADSLSGQFSGIIAGGIFSILLQSSTTVVFLTIELASQGIIDLPSGFAFILGANVGTTITAMIVSIEHDNDVKKLAFSHFLIKLIGVGITLFFFPYFLSFIELIIPGKMNNENIVYYLAASHSVFNIINMFWWSFFYVFLLKFLNVILPSQIDKISSLPSVIRKIIANSPSLAAEEIKKQITNLENITKNLTDYCIELLTAENPTKIAKHHYSVSGKDYENIKEPIFEILIQLTKKQNLSPEQFNFIRSRYNFISECSDFYYHSLSFCSHLERGLFIDFYGLPVEIRTHFEQFETLFNELWMTVLLNKTSSERIHDLKSLLGVIEKSYFDLIKSKSKLKNEHLTWIYETISFLNQLVEHLIHLCNAINNYNEVRLT